MVPDAFHDFFVASAGVAGALVGLLFVAISVRPEQLGEGGDAALRFRPTAALSALLNTLLVSLILLIPQTRVGTGVAAAGTIGLAAVLTLLVGLLPQVRRGRRVDLLRAAVLLLGQGVVYGYEIALGLRMRREDEPVTELQSLCVLVIVLFFVGIERAWEFVGARMPRLVSAVLGSTRTTSPGDAGRSAERGPADVG